MGVDYQSLALTAQRLIDENGRDVTLIKLDRDPNNPLEPWRPQTPTPTVIGPLRGVLVPFNEKDIDGELVRRGDQRGLVAALDTNPELIEEFDQLNDNGDVWKILAVKTINPGPTRLIYILTLRK